jgi:cellobiose phosphorylase
MFFVHHLLGVRPSRNELVIRPRLLTGIESVEATLHVRGYPVDISVATVETGKGASVNGRAAAMVNGALKLPLLRKKTRIEMRM